MGALAVLAALALSTGAFAQGGPPPPSAGEVIASGVSSTGGAIGPDGALYAGVGGTAKASDTEITLPAEMAEMFGIESVLFGLHSTVMRVDPDTGEATVYADLLPSASDSVGGEPFIAPADVIWVGGSLYILLTGGAPSVGGPAAGWPNGIYRLQGDDSWRLIADINAFNVANPVDFPDAAPEGNPFAIDYRDGVFIVSDGNHNRILRATMDGDVDEIAAFDNVVPTGLAAGGPGPILNTWFSAAPHFPNDSYIASIAYPTGATTPISGSNQFAQLIDVEYGPGGAVYVLQFGDQQLDEAGPPPPGRLLRWTAEGTFDVLVTGLFLPTSVNFSGDTAFITSLTGDVLKIEGVSGLQPIDEVVEPEPTTPPAPVPTSPPSGPISPPDTGSGAATGGSSRWAFGVMALIFGAAALGAGTVASRR
jgi:sugar lactone lactonase YvrE